MFLAQAARQFEIWTGHRAPAEIFEEKSALMSRRLLIPGSGQHIESRCRL